MRRHVASLASFVIRIGRPRNMSLLHMITHAGAVCPEENKRLTKIPRDGRPSGAVEAARKSLACTAGWTEDGLHGGFVKDRIAADE